MQNSRHLRIRSIEVSNFKSLVGFRVHLAKFSCLIGLNGVGKSTVLQFIDFISRLVRGDVEDWLGEREWKSADLKSKLTPRNNIQFKVQFADLSGTPAGRWEAQYNPSSNRCTSERIDMLDYVLETHGEKVRLFGVKTNTGNGDSWERDITFAYEGSILSALKEKFLPASVLECKRFFQRTESLDMLTPERLRQKTRSASGSLGHGGRNLSAFVYELGAAGRKALAAGLKQAYPQLSHVYAKSLRSGWKQLIAREVFGNQKLATEARHVNDGLLRLIAILAQARSDHSFILFDEIENGINPEIVEFVIETLVNAPQQVIVTTHSPMILNYLDDAKAASSVIYLYRSRKGFTQAIPFFQIPSLKKKLQVMGPGEAFADTNLTELSREIAGMSTKEA